MCLAASEPCSLLASVLSPEVHLSVSVGDSSQTTSKFLDILRFLIISCWLSFQSFGFFKGKYFGDIKFVLKDESIP